jgi:hypothetical protein
MSCLFCFKKYEFLTLPAHTHTARLNCVSRDLMNQIPTKIFPPQSLSLLTFNVITVSVRHLVVQRFNPLFQWERDIGEFENVLRS